MLTVDQNLPVTPVIETGRLRLRGHRPDDFDAIHAMWSDERVYRYISGKTSSLSESQGRLTGSIGHWAAYGFGYWVVEEKQSRAFVGTIGFGQFRRNVAPAIDDMPEIGWVLAPAAHGKGYGTEGAAAAVAWGDKHFGSNATCCIFHPDHIASMRVAQKLGYELWQVGTFEGEETPIYVRSAPR